MIADYLVVAWALVAIGAVLNYWYIIAIIALVMGFTFTIRAEMKLQRFLHEWKTREWDWRYDG